MVTPLLSFIAALVATLIFTPVVRALAMRWNIVDSPDGHRKLQKKAIPLLGGIAVFAGWWLGLGSVVACGLPLVLPSITPWAALTLAALALIGVVDDSRNLSAQKKLFFQMLAVLPVALSSSALARLTFGGWTLELGIWSVPATTLWLLLGINSLNLIDGMDGMASTVGLCIAMTASAIDFASGGGTVAAFAVPLAGALLGFLVFNRPPASIYLGDTGSMIVGFAVSLAALYAAQTNGGVVHFTLMFAIMSVPLTDTLLAILRRWLGGHSIWDADRGHIHHRLIDAGWRPGQILGLLAILSLSWGTLITVVRQGKFEFAIWGTGMVAAMLGIRYRVAGHHEWSLLTARVRGTGDRLTAVPSVAELAGAPFDTSWTRLVQACAEFSCQRVAIIVHQADGSWSEYDWVAESNCSPLGEFAVEIHRLSSNQNSCRLRIETSDKSLDHHWSRAIVMLERFAQFWADHPQAVPATSLRLHDYATSNADAHSAPTQINQRRSAA